MNSQCKLTPISAHPSDRLLASLPRDQAAPADADDELPDAVLPRHPARAGRVQRQQEVVLEYIEGRPGDGDHDCCRRRSGEPERASGDGGSDAEKAVRVLVGLAWKRAVLIRFEDWDLSSSPYSTGA